MSEADKFVERYRNGYGDISVAIQHLEVRAKAEAQRCATWEALGRAAHKVEAERDAALSTIAKVREILAHDEIEGWEHDEWVYRQESDRKLSEIEDALTAAVASPQKLVLEKVAEVICNAIEGNESDTPYDMVAALAICEAHEKGELT